MEVGLLIGSNCPDAIMPREVIPGNPNEPYAQRTKLGWGIIGNVNKYSNDGDEGNSVIAHRVTTSDLSRVNSQQEKTCYFAIKPTVREVFSPAQLRQMFELDFSERKGSGPSMSQEDRKFLSKMEESAYQAEDGHYVMPLPFRHGTPHLPNNRSLALNRLSKLRTRLNHDERYRKDYTAFMTVLIKKGYAERVPEDELTEESGKVWYIPHHGICHPRKPDKIRVVFDCSSKYKGESINRHLLQGPDLTNQLIGVLYRFRQDPVAFTCDVESMFHQFRVATEYRNFLRFFWWPDSDSTKPPIEYRMTVHLFGAASSPGCANYGLKRIAHDHEKEFGTDAANFVKYDFYVDDGLKSVGTAEHAISLVEKTKQLCTKGGLRLHKFVSNSKKVIAAIPPEDRSSQLKNLDLGRDPLPLERALGVQWCSGV